MQILSQKHTKLSVLFSGKITNSVITFFEQKGLDLEPIFDVLDIPVEFLQDTSSWIDAKQIEQFLQLAQKQCDVVEIGHSCKDLKSWGVLDNVLKMLNKPEDIYNQPERFLSYFIKPAPPIGNVQRSPYSIKFELPIFSEEYPLSTQYLRAALEGLPAYVGKNYSTATWKDQVIQISWANQQESLFSDDVGSLVNPDLVKNLVVSLEKQQKELEEKNRELLEKNQQLQEAKEQLEKHFQEKVYTEKLSGLSELAAALSHEINNPLTYVMSNVFRLHDYMVRAQQLITIIVGKDRMTPQVQEAMRRMDWDYISKEFPQVVSEANEGLQKVRQIVRDLAFLAGSSKEEGERVPTQINDVIESAIKVIQPTIPHHVRVERMLLMDKPISVYPLRMEQALVNLMQNAVQSIEQDGWVRVCTRPKGDRLLIEVTDSGKGMDESTINKIFTPFFTTKEPGRGTGLGLSIAQSVVRMHDGNLSVTSKPEQGSTFTIELPIL